MVRGSGAEKLVAVLSGLACALLLVAFSSRPSAQPSELLSKSHKPHKPVTCTKVGCVEFDGKKPLALPKMPDWPSAKHLGILGQVGRGDVENYAGALAVAGAKSYRHPSHKVHPKPKSGLRVAKGQQQLRIFGFKDGSEHLVDHNPQHETYWISDEKNWNNEDLNGENKQAPKWWAKGRANQPEPVVVWGSHYTGEDMEVAAGEEKLVKHGVNVDSKDGLIKMLPLPNLDPTEYSVKHHSSRLPPKNAEAEQDQEAKSDRKLQKAGVLVEGSKIKLFPAPQYPEESYFHKVDDLGDKIVRKSRCTYAKLDFLAGMQKRHSYLADANFPSTEKDSKEALEKAGVKVWGLKELRGGVPWPPYHMPGGGCYAEAY